MSVPSSTAKFREVAARLLGRLHDAPGMVGFRKKSLDFIARFSRHSPRSLASRILLLQFFWTLFIYILVIAALWFATNLVVENSVHHQGEGWIAKLDDLGTPIYATNNPAQLKKVIDYLRDFPEVAQAKYLDDTGQEKYLDDKGKKIPAEYTRKGVQISNFSPLTDDDIQRLGRTDVEQKVPLFKKSGNSQMRISAPIWIKSIASDGMIDFKLGQKSREKIETIGYIELILDYSKVTSDLNHNIAYASIIIAVMMLVAALILRIMVRWALKPLSELEQPLTRLANGETDITVKTSGDKEIARIGVALNTTINALRERDEALRRMADHDGLTGLVNRAYFVERLEQEVKKVAQGGTNGALFFFDLDRFKNINDTYGHAAGDRLLIQVAKQLGPRIREHDIFARYGGDEFTLLAYNVDPQKVHEIAEAFIALMREFTFYEAGDTIKIYFSIGVTLINSDSLTTQEYLKEADTAVHQAKTQGRNCFRIFSRETESSAAETGVGWHERLQEVLREKLVILHYQSMVGLQGQPENMHEVLLRLPDMEQLGTEQKVISPGAFMSAAERFGLMQEFDCQVIDKAALTLSGLGSTQTVFSVNLSEQFFAKDDIPGFLEAIVAARQIEPSRFIFELSQSYIVRNIERLQAVMAELSRRGYRFAIDDFGADFGSFNYIKKFPVHFLKIDGSLIEHITTDRIAKATVRAIVEVAAELHMQTIAKNVDDEAGVALLRELGVDYAQGNYIAAPAPQLHGASHAAQPKPVKKSRKA